MDYYLRSHVSILVAYLLRENTHRKGEVIWFCPESHQKLLPIGMALPKLATKSAIGLIELIEIKIRWASCLLATRAVESRRKLCKSRKFGVFLIYPTSSIGGLSRSMFVSRSSPKEVFVVDLGSFPSIPGYAWMVLNLGGHQGCCIASVHLRSNDFPIACLGLLFVLSSRTSVFSPSRTNPHSLSSLLSHQRLPMGIGTKLRPQALHQRHPIILHIIICLVITGVAIGGSFALANRLLIRDIKFTLSLQDNSSPVVGSCICPPLHKVLMYALY
jgi:hypothetical protein